MSLTLRKFLGVIIPLVLLAGMIFLRVKISTGFDVQNSNFAFFWLAGKMILTSENPYDETQYIAGHATYGIKWQPNRIFPYPLPLALLCIPLGFFTMSGAYTAWQIVSLIIIAVVVYVLLNQWKDTAQSRLFVPLFFFLLFFGPEYLSLHTGTIGALSLLFILLALLFLNKGASLPAGFFLALTMIKPPQGLTILILAGIWFLARRDWKAIAGVVLGGLTILVVGLIQDPQWIQKFLGASNAVMDRTEGVHSNVWAFAYLACNGASPCWTILGGILSLILLGAAGFFLWRNQAKWSAWEAMNVILPVGFVSTIYLWAYDQLPFLLPIVWIVGTFVQKTGRYWASMIFIILLDLVSLFALYQQAETRKDLWSLGTTLLVLASLFFAARMKSKPAIDKAPASA